MALKVWLPLNGNLKNIGTDGGELTTSQTNIWNDNGKIGKCLLGNAQASATFPSLINATNFSIAYWLYIDSSLAIQNWYDIWNVFCTIGSTSANIRDEFKNAAGVHQVLIGKDTTVGGNTNNYYGLGVSDSNAKDKWVHITIVKSNSDVKTFIDGVLSNTIINSNFENSPQKLTGKITLGNMTTSTAARINDFRVYDHCLSKLEVKEVAQGLVLHYKLDGFSGGAGENLLQGSASIGSSSTPGWVSNGSATNITVIDGNTIHYQYNLNNTKHIPSIVSNVVAPLEWGKTYVYSMDLKCSEDIDLKAATPQHWWLGARNADNIWQVSINSHSIANGTTKVEYLKNHSGTLPANTWVNITTRFTIRGDAPESGYDYPALRPFVFGQVLTEAYTGTVQVWMKNCKIEEGSVATPWCPVSDELGKDLTKIVDSSGYGNNGTVVGSLTFNSQSKKYNSSTYFGNSPYIDTGSGTFNWFQFDACTIAAWIKSSASKSGWSGSIGVQHNQNAGHKGFTISNYGNTFRAVLPNGSYTVIDSTKSLAVGEWHHCVATLNGTTLKMYYDGALIKEQTISWGSAAAATDLRFAVGVDFPGSDEKFAGDYSDIRFYTTALSADDVLALYKTSAQIDKSKGFHTFAISEGSDKAVRKNGITEIQNISEFDALSYLKYDPNLHIEPDGSAWVHIYHHNHPNLGSFASTDTFATSVKKDENRWFNGTQVCNQLNKWEFLIKYAFTEGGTEYKERWIQTKNPENAVFGDVDPADVTRITGDGYKTGTWGGLYKKNSSAYWVLNNTNSGNWWGATGSFSVYEGGIPGYGGTITTTGYNDLYVRIDNVLSTVSTNSRITKNGILIGSNFIEK